MKVSAGNSRRFEYALCIALAIAASVEAGDGRARATAPCESLVGLQLPDTTVRIAQSYAAGQLILGVTKAPTGLCRVAGTVRPSSDSNINFEVWIPTDRSWNGKYEQIGNGGFAGTIWSSYLANAVSRGYAAAATDDGTSGPPRGGITFLGHPDIQIDYAYRAIKVTRDNSRSIIEKLTGKYPRYSYFTGCSDGGREALMVAQRYPDDFNGVIVGSPSNDQVGLLGASFLWNMQALLTGPQSHGIPDSYIPADKLGLLSTQALAQCAGRDGGVSTDSFLNDPRLCRFDPATAGCEANQNSKTCLSSAQIEAARKIYAGAPNSKGGLLFPGYEPGSEANAANWPRWLVGTSPTAPGIQNSLTEAFWCDLVFEKSSCPYLTLSLADVFEKAVRTIAPILNATDPDLGPFKRRGGKVIQYAGWADSAIAPENGLNYYRKVASIMGDVHDFYRVFMVPGMAHCYGGAGPNSFGNGINNGPVIDAGHDLLKALEGWVEAGIAPTEIIATKYVNDSPTLGIAFQRPLCPYPQTAKYDGHGTPTDASSFRCTADQLDYDPRNRGPQAAYR
jgi:Tannase and feruloyl esterase